MSGFPSKLPSANLKNMLPTSGREKGIQREMPSRAWRNSQREKARESKGACVCVGCALPEQQEEMGAARSADCGSRRVPRCWVKLSVAFKCCICNHPGWGCCRIIKKWCFEKIQERGAVNLVGKKRPGEQLSQRSAFCAIILKPPQQQKPLSISTLVPGHLNSSGLSSSLLQFDATLIQSAKNLGYQTDTDPAFRLPKGETDTYTEPET
ncbi:uncharacterized protein LOC132659145 [Ovis aries]|uniref:uncharacterized protein LOC132659145 n=1 Tax=Ovis aries TaxID=9940 RepID=UPI0029528BB1|nr:uncharacterized protein LOC132659145 [Ovis aries]